MRKLLQKFPLGVVAGSKDDFGDGPAADLAGGVENAVAPALAKRGDDWGLAKHGVACFVSIEHDSAQIAQHVGDHAFATRNATGKTEDQHLISSKFKVQSSKFKVILSTLNFELGTWN